jgi:hypothetical protein
MSTRQNDNLDTRMLVAQERRRWRKQGLLAPQSFDDFQELAESAFRDLRRKGAVQVETDAGNGRRRAGA